MYLDHYAALKLMVNINYNSVKGSVHEPTLLTIPIETTLRNVTTAVRNPK